MTNLERAIQRAEKHEGAKITIENIRIGVKQTYIEYTTDENHTWFYEAPYCTLSNYMDSAYKEIPLTPMEKDLIATYSDIDYVVGTDYWHQPFYEVATLDGLKAKGYYAGVTDTTLTLQEIWENKVLKED